MYKRQILDGFGLARAQIEELILAARAKAGWIEEIVPVEEPVEGEDVADANTDIQEADTSGASAS